jgi:uncharacterized membrane protein
MNDQSQSDINTILENGYSVNISAYFIRGWEIFKNNPALFIQFELLTFGLNKALDLVPLIGTTSSFILGIPLYAGGLIVAFKIAANQTVRFEDFFQGFRNIYFSKLLLTSLVMGILIGLCIVVAGISFNFSGIGSILVRSFAGRSVDLGILIPMILLMLLSLSGAIYLCTAYFFAIPLVIDRRMEFWPALEMSRQLVRRNLCGIFGFELVLALLSLCGDLYFELVSLIANPIATCIIAAAYERIVGLSNSEPS